MKYPIVKVQTKDGLILNGLLHEKSKSSKIVINIHGSASNFYEEQFFENMFVQFPKRGFSFLSINNRGNSVLTHTWQKTGSALEKFEDCILDFDAWIEFVLKKGYSTIILQGHSLGTEKIVYYMSKGKHRDKVSGVILLGFSDSYGCTIKFMEKSKSKEALFSEAKKLVSAGKGEQFLTTEWYSHAGILPKSAESFLNQFSENSELSKAFPFRTRKLEFYSKIKVPILAVISGNDKHTADTVVTDGSEHTVIPVKEAAELLKKSNKKTTVAIIPETNHDFEGKEKEVTKVVGDFLVKNNF
jgi:alpha-beta hydrolase superfamily lysophospholipase